jgi:hypothetical protein
VVGATCFAVPLSCAPCTHMCCWPPASSVPKLQTGVHARPCPMRTLALPSVCACCALFSSPFTVALASFGGSQLRVPPTWNAHFRGTHPNPLGSVACLRCGMPPPGDPAKSKIKLLNLSFAHIRLLHPRWLGIFGIVGGETANLFAYGFAPASIVTPVGAVGVMTNIIITTYGLKERFHVAQRGSLPSPQSPWHNSPALSPHFQKSRGFDGQSVCGVSSGRGILPANSTILNTPLLPLFLLPFAPQYLV